MFGFEHALDSSTSSSSLSSLASSSSWSLSTDKQRCTCDCEAALVATDEAHKQKLNQEELSEKTSGVFLSHLRKCFIALDDTNCCENGILPDLRVQDKLTDRQYAKKSNRTESDAVATALLSKRIQVKAYEYTKIPKANSRFNQSSQLLKKSQSFNSSAKKEDKPLSTENQAAVDTSNDTLSEYLRAGRRPLPPKVMPVPMATAAMTAAMATATETETALPPTIQLNRAAARKNEFSAYAKQEAPLNESHLSQRFHIFLPMCDSDGGVRVSKKSWLDVNIYKSACISDLIGLICYKFTYEQKSPMLKYRSVKNYILKIADETGDIEDDLPNLESTHLVSRFGFTYLALIERPPADDADSSSNNRSLSRKSVDRVRVLIHFTDESESQTLVFENDNVPMSDIYDQVFMAKMQAADMFCPPLTYRLENIAEPDVPIDVQSKYLNNFKIYEFYFIRANSVRARKSITPQQDDPIAPNQLASEFSHLVTGQIATSGEFYVMYLSKWKKVPFKIELSRDSVELEEDPAQITRLRLSRKKSQFYIISMANVVSFSDLKTNTTRRQFRVIVVEENTSVTADNRRGQIYKHLDFECDASHIDSIKSAFTNNMLICKSAHFVQYNRAKETSSKWSRKAHRALKS